MNQLKSKIEKTILNYFPPNSVHGLGNAPIPSKKLENVKALHTIDEEEEVLFLYDATLFGSAKDGMVFTDKGIYWREVLDSPKSLYYKELVESTANKNWPNKEILILDRDEKITIKENYYKLICDLRSEIINASIIYETYYKSALESVEESLARLLKKEQFFEIINWLNRYGGLYLKLDHKSAKIREIAFKAYLGEKIFSKAQFELSFLKDANPEFYRESSAVLDLVIKEERYMTLEKQRIEAIVAEEYDLAFLLLENQKELKLKDEIEIEKIRTLIEQSKKEVLLSHQEQLNRRLEEEELIEAEQLMEQIYKIEPTYPLEREKILLMLCKFDLKKAKEEISRVSNPMLKLELEETLIKTTKRLHERIRSAARNKRYDLFESRPDIWRYKDEYGMCALAYFALEADLEGILKALDHVTPLLMPANIFGHNFVDLIGFACDPVFGNKKENPLTILQGIKDKVDLKQIDDRINFLETGQEGYFFSYKLSQKDRLSELNQKLMSVDHFRYVLIEIENPTNNHVDKIMKHLFAGELEALDIYPQKDEFETAEDYARRCKVFKKQYLDRDDFVAEYKKQNKQMVEGITQLLEDKKSCFIPRISAIVEYKNKELQTLKSLKTPVDILELVGLYFPTESETLPVEMGSYDAERQAFLIKVNGKIEEMPIPLPMARELRETADEIEFVRRRIIKDGKITWGTVPK